MKQFSLSLLLVCGVLGVFSVPAHSIDTGRILPLMPSQSRSVILAAVSEKDLTRAQEFVSSLSSQGIAYWGDSELSEAQRAAKFKRLLERSFDMSTIGRFVLGRYWRTASSAQRSEYQKLFKAMIVNVYSKRFGEYQGQTLDVVKARPEGKYDILVSSFIVPNSGSKISLDWRVREKEGHFKVIDIIVEGVSMGLTHRSDFSSVIQRGGGDMEVLLAHLRDK